MNKDILNNTQMLIHRSPKRFDKNYTGGDFFDSQMSLKSKGLLGHLLKKPHNWRIYVSQLVKVLPEGKDAIYSSLRELEKNGHVVKTQIRGAHGCIKGVLYTVYEDPITQDDDSVIAFNDVDETFVDQGLSLETEDPRPVNTQLQIESLNDKNKDNNCCSFENEEKEKQVYPNALKAQEAPLEDFKTVSNPIVEVWPSNEKPERKNEYLLKHCLSQKYLVETTLGKTLTPTQEAIVGDVAAAFTGGGEGGAKELKDWLIQTLVNPRAFSRSGESFVHKLNAVITKLRVGAYTRPYAMRYGVRAGDANPASQQGQQHESLKERLRARAWENVRSDKGLDYADTRSNENTENSNTELLKDLNRQLAKVNKMLKKKISQLERESLNALAQTINMRKQEFLVVRNNKGI